MAMVGETDFLIGLHGTFEKGTSAYKANEYFVNYGEENNVKVC